MRCLAIGAAVVLWAVLCGHVVVAAEPEVTYPHINTATWFQMDPTWPRLKQKIEWGQTSGVVLDRNDRVWVLHRGKQPVQLYDVDGRFIRGWGDDVLKLPHGLRLDGDGNVWITDCETHVVMQFTPEGKLLRTMGTPGIHGEDATHFYLPTDVAITPKGEVFVADGYGNSRIVHYDRDGKFVKAWGKLGTGPGEFSVAHAIVRDSQGRLYVADRNNARIQVFDQNGKFLDQWRNLLVPWGLCVDKNDNIWACGSSTVPWFEDQEYEYLGVPPKDQLVMQFDRSGKLLTLWVFPKGEKGKTRLGEVNWIHACALDSAGNLFAAEIMGKKVQKFLRQGPTTAVIEGQAHCRSITK